MLSWHKNKKLWVIGKESLQFTKNLLPEVFCEKGVLKNFAIITEKHLPWSLLSSFVCQKLIKGLFKKEAVRFLQSEEISFKLPYNLHYNSNKFSLEAHHLFHPQTMST